jgi:hypothetical protein
VLAELWGHQLLTEMVVQVEHTEVAEVAVLVALVVLMVAGALVALQ